MITQTVTVTEKGSQNIIIGRRNTYGTELIVFDLSYLIETFGDGSAILMVKRSTDSTAYPAVTEQIDNRLSWSISDVDTSYKGHGEAELFWYVDDALAKSVIYDITVLRDIGETTETPPDPYQTWVDTLTDLGAETLENAQAAAQSAEDAESAKVAAVEAQEEAEAASQAIQDMSVSAQSISHLFPASVEKTVDPETGAVSLLFNIPGGADGTSYVVEASAGAIVKNNNNNTFSPTTLTLNAYTIRDGVRTNYIASEIGAIIWGSGYVPMFTARDTNTLTFTIPFVVDNGYIDCYIAGVRGRLASIKIPVLLDGMNGEDGNTPHFTIGNTSTLQPGSDATVTQTGTDENPVLNFGIPEGSKGDPGDDGVSPTVSTQAITGGTEVTITDKTGDHTFDVMDGQDAVVDPTLSIQGEAADAKATGDAISALNSAINSIEINKADVIISSASGAIASFSDGMEAPIKSVTINVDPDQDLHGYDSPWPPGGGNNKCNYDVAYAAFSNHDGTFTGSNSSQGSITSVKIPLGAFVGKTVTFSMTVTATSGDTNVWFIQADINGTRNSSTETNRFHYQLDTAPKRIYQTCTPETANDTIALSYGSGSGSLTIKDIQLEVGGSMTPWSPYENICPISAQTQAILTGIGKNFADVTDLAGTSGQYSVTVENGVATGKATDFGVIDGDRSGHVNEIRVPAEKCTISLTAYTDGDSTTTGTGLYFIIVYDDGTSSASTAFLNNQTTPTTKTFTTNGKSGQLVFTYSSGGPNTWHLSKFQIELGSSATEYEKRVRSTKQIAFPDAAGTVYQAKIKGNEDGTGKLSVIKAKIVLDDTVPVTLNNWNADANGVGWIYPQSTVGINDIHVTSQTLPDMYCDTLPVKKYDQLFAKNVGIGVYQNYGTYSIVVWYPDPTLTTPTAIYNFLASNPITVLYKLSTPVEYDLTVEQMGIIRTLYGINNFFADTGDVIVEHRCDTKLYIQQLTMPTEDEDDMISNNAISSGKFFMIGNRLFLSTASIASGAKIIPGTNCTALSLADALNSL